MSRHFVTSFFPEVSNSPLSFIIDYLFPPETALQCPEVVLLGIRNPSVATAAILGLVIGFRGALRHRQEPLWSTAFLFFGLMNVVALPLHSFIETPLPQDDNNNHLAPFYAPWLWALDCLFTGISSSALVAACFPRISTLWMQGSLVLAGLAIVFFWRHSMTLWIELYYLVPMGLALDACLYVILTSDCAGAKRFLLAGGALAGIGIMFDASLCSMTVDPFYDLVSAPTLMFVGSNVAFLGVSLWMDERRSKSNSGKLA